MKTFLLLLTLACGRLTAAADDVIDLIMDVHSPWQTLSVSYVHHCSCLGPVLERGIIFKQERPNEITLMTWHRKDFKRSNSIIQTPWRKLKDCTPSDLRDDVVKVLRAGIASDSFQKRYHKLPLEKRAEFVATLTKEQQVVLRQSGDDTELMISLSMKDGTVKRYFETFVDEQESVLHQWMKKVAPEITVVTYP